MKVWKDAFADLEKGFAMRRMWWAMASEDISDEHRRTTLGSIWLLVNYLIFVGAVVLLMGGPDNVPNFPAYVGISLFLWFYITEVVNSGIAVFAREESFIKGTTLPMSIYVLRLTTHAVIRAAYAVVGCIVVIALSGAVFGPSWFASLLGLAIIVFVTPAAILIVGFLGAYFPDSQMIVQNLMRVGLFVTPIFWAHVGGLDGSLRSYFYYFNPFTYFIEMVRVPIVSGEIPVRSILLCLAISVGAWLVALLLLGKLRKQIVYVL
jgi:ABC-type polysaccharide/polyol phosphate export permease